MLAPLLLSVVIGQAADAPPWAERLDRRGDLLPAGAVARFGTVRYRHGTEIVQLAVSPSGKYLATRAKDDAELRLWEFATGRQVGQLTPKDLTIQRLAFLTDDLVAVVADDGVHLWPAGRPPARLPSHLLPEKASAVAVSPDGKTLAIGGEKAIHLMPLDSPKGVTRTLAAAVAPFDLVYSPDGKWLAGGSAANLAVWSLTTGKRVRSFVAPDTPTVRFTPRSDRLYCLTSTAVRLLAHDSDEDDPAFEPYASEKKLADLRLSGDGKTLYVLECSGVLHRLDAATGKVGKPAEPPTGVQEWACAALTPDARAVVSRWADQRWVTWNPVTGTHSAADAATPLVALRLSADGKVATCQDENDCFRTWAVADGKPLDEYRPRGKNSPGGAVADETGERLLYEIEGKETVCLRVKDGELLKRQSAEAVAGQGRQFLTGHPRRFVRFAPELVQLCDLDGDRPARPFPYAAPAGQGCAALSPDGRMLVLGGRKDETAVMETATGKVRLTVKVTASEIRFAPDGRTLGVGETGGFVTLVDTVTARHLRQVSLIGSGHTHFAFSPDGKQFAASCRGSDRTIQVWSTATGDLMSEFPGHASGSITGLEYTPDGTRLVTSGSDGCGYVWDLRYRKPAEPLGRLFSFATPADARAALASADGEEAYQAVAYLVGRPAEALTELAAAVRPATGPTADETGRWIARLASKEFKERDAARKALADAGAAAAAALRTEARAPATPESGRVAAELAARLDRGYSAAADLLAARAVETAERIGTPAARRLLAAWADGPPAATLTVEAKAALGRRK